MTDLGKLIQIKNLRDFWPDEARHFTPWLAKEDNLALIGETLGFGRDWLELVELEAVVGRFSADILCQDTGSEDSFVIIENQFGQTDHDHLGKLLTYAAGRKAKTVIWISEYIRDEHRAALELLNDATSEDYQFFALEIELWKIGDSAVAPRFSVIAKPNEWSRTAKTMTRRATAEGLSDLKKQYVRYWAAFRQMLADKSDLRAQKASPQQWIHMPIGRAHFTLTANVNSREKWIMAQLELHQDDAAGYFELLERDRKAIDEECPFELTWEALPHRKSARISVKRSNTDPTAEEMWEDQHTWLVERLVTLRDVFRDRVHALELDEIAEKPPHSLNGDE